MPFLSPGSGGGSGDVSAVEVRVTSLENQRGSALGIATLDAAAKVPSSQLPDIAAGSSVNVCSNQAEMLAISGTIGAVAVRTDINKTFALKAEPATLLGNWQELLSPPDAVNSVNGKTGDLTLSFADVGAIPATDKATQEEFDALTVGKLPDSAMVQSAIANSVTSLTSYTDQEVSKLNAKLLGGDVNEALDTFFELQGKLASDDTVTTQILTELSQKLPTSTFDSFVIAINQSVALKADKTELDTYKTTNDKAIDDLEKDLTTKVDNGDYEALLYTVENEKQNITDDSLLTTSKTVAGAINELHDDIANISPSGSTSISDTEIALDKAFSNQHVQGTFQPLSDPSITGDDKTITGNIETLKTDKVSSADLFTTEGKVKPELIEFVPDDPIVREKIWSGLHVLEKDAVLDVGIDITDTDGFYLQFQDMNGYPDSPSAGNYNYSLHYCPVEFNGLMQMIQVPTYIVSQVSSGDQPNDVSKVLEFVINGSTITGSSVSNIVGAGADTCLTAVYVGKRVSYASNIVIPRNEPIKREPCRYVAHRGYSDRIPENSRKAYIAAGELGFWGAEADIAETLDGYFVLMHDSTVDRTTNGSGRLREMTLAEVRALTIDDTTEVTGYHELYASNDLAFAVPTLEEWMEICVKYGTHPVVELKNLANNDTSVRKVMDVVESYVGNDFTVASFNYEQVATARYYNPNCSVHYFNSSILADDVLNTIKAANIVISMSHTFAAANTGYVDTLKSKGVSIACWTVNDNLSANKMLDLGMSFITTDRLIDYQYQASKMIGLSGVNYSAANTRVGSWGGGNPNSDTTIEYKNSLNIFKEKYYFNDYSLRCHSTNLVNITSCDRGMMHSENTSGYGAALVFFDGEGDQLTDLTWLNDVESTGYGVVDIEFLIPAGAVWCFAYFKKLDNTAFTDSDMIAVRKIKFSLWHNNTSASFDQSVFVEI